MTVKSYPSREIIKNYGTVADMVAAGEPVRVTKHGRTAYYMIPPSDFAEGLFNSTCRPESNGDVIIDSTEADQGNLIPMEMMKRDAS